MQLNDPKVRLLHWCINSPELAHAKAVLPLKQEASSKLNNWLISLDQKPAKLHQFLKGSTTKRLGIYFEKLWQFYLEHGPQWQLLGHNLQIIEQKKTLGELDILAHNQLSGYYHIELAVKFYLQYPGQSGQECQHWIGPQTRDQLDIKLKTLNKRQFPILHHDQTQELLSSFNIDQTIQQRLVLKGYLFHQFQHAYLLPIDVNHQCNIGQWLHQKNISALTQDHDTWAFIEKQQWLGPLVLPKVKDDHVTMCSAMANQFVQDHFSAKPNNHALMLIKLNEKPDTYEEQTRYLIVSDAWPNL